MTAPTITPLYDIELESLMDDEATCSDCPKPAVARMVLVTCGCEGLMCVTHERGMRDEMRLPFSLECVEHPGRRLGPNDIRIYPI